MLIICNVSHLFCSSQRMNLAPPVFKCLHRNKQGLASLGRLHSNSCFSHYTGTQTLALHRQTLSSLAFSGLSIITSLQPHKGRKGGERGTGREGRGKGKKSRLFFPNWPFVSVPLQPELLTRETFSHFSSIPNTKQVQVHSPTSCFFPFPKAAGNRCPFQGGLVWFCFSTSDEQLEKPSQTSASALLSRQVGERGQWGAWAPKMADTTF